MKECSALHCHQPNAFLMLLPRFEKNPEIPLLDLDFFATTFLVATAASTGGVVFTLVVEDVVVTGAATKAGDTVP